MLFSYNRTLNKEMHHTLKGRFNQITNHMDSLALFGKFCHILAATPREEGDYNFVCGVWKMSLNKINSSSLSE